MNEIFNTLLTNTSSDITIIQAMKTRQVSRAAVKHLTKVKCHKEVTAVKCQE